jgi:capsular exopolysaccharide synthesis family protein
MNLQSKDLQEYIGLLWKWWWILLLGAVLGAGVGYIMSHSETPIYEAKVTLIIGNFVLQSSNPDTGELATSQTLAQSYAEIIRREPVLRATAEALGANIDWVSLKNKVSGRLVPNTQLFEVRVVDGDPLMAQKLANELARQLILQSPTNLNQEQQVQRDFVQTELAQLQESIIALREQIKDEEAALDLEVTVEGIQKKQAEIDFLRARLSALQNNYASLLTFSQENQVNQLTVIEPATIPPTPINTNNPQRRALQGGAIGLALALGIIFLLEHFDNTIKTSDDVEQILNLPTLTAVGYSGTIRSANNYVVVSHGVFSPLAEAYRILRTNLQFANPELSLNTLLVTSSLAGEGKSLTAINLAVVMAQTDKRVILVDADLRRPILHKAFKISNRFGVSTLLLNQGPALENVLAKRKVHNLQILPSGPPPPNPTELLGSPQMEKLLVQLRQMADVVIIDSPPLLALTDARVLAIQADATILVVDAGRTQSRVCQRAQAMLAQVGVQPIGVVLNKFKPKRTVDEYHYSYYYSPYSTSNHGKNGREKIKKEHEPFKF